MLVVDIIENNSYSNGVLAVGQAVEGHLFRLSVLACPTALQGTTQKEGGTAVDLNTNFKKEEKQEEAHCKSTFQGPLRSDPRKRHYRKATGGLGLLPI